jgi:hypothetical protein
MALGVTDHVWTIGELVVAALESDTPPPLPRPTSDLTLRAAPPKLRLILDVAVREPTSRARTANLTAHPNNNHHATLIGLTHRGFRHKLYFYALAENILDGIVYLVRSSICIVRKND